MNNCALVRLADAYAFAAIRHVEQTRKGEAAEPYVNHLTEVASLVAEATGGADAELVMAAVLHDSVEDVGVTFAELESRFGARVARLVDEVTDDKRLEKHERKRLQVEHAAHASPEAQILKIADKVSNLRSLASSPPKGWSPDRRREYLDWARRVVAGCRQANDWLAGRFDDAAAELDAQLGAAPRTVDAAPAAP